jgi:DNA topoisomerase-1
MAKIKMKDLQLHRSKHDCKKLRHAHFVADSKYKKEKRYAEDKSDLDENAVTEHEEQCKACKIEKPEKKIAKENEKLVKEGKPAQDKDSVRWRLTAIDVWFVRLEKERGTGEATIQRDKLPGKLFRAIDGLGENIKSFKL